MEQDPLLKGRPIALNRVDGHARWVSPRVLEIMGNLPDQVEGGLIIRDINGHPTGKCRALRSNLILYCTGVFVDNAMELIPNPPWSADRVSNFFETTMKDALMHGLTSIHDADATSIDFFKRFVLVPFKFFIIIVAEI